MSNRAYPDLSMISPGMGNLSKAPVRATFSRVGTDEPSPLCAELTAGSRPRPSRPFRTIEPAPLCVDLVRPSGRPTFSTSPDLPSSSALCGPEYVLRLVDPIARQDHSDCSRLSGPEHDLLRATPSRVGILHASPLRADLLRSSRPRFSSTRS